MSDVDEVIVSEDDVETALLSLIDMAAGGDIGSEAPDLEMDDLWYGLENSATFQAEGVMTMNKGLVLKFMDGTEYQVTIVRSR